MSATVKIDTMLIERFVSVDHGEGHVSLTMFRAKVIDPFSGTAAITMTAAKAEELAEELHDAAMEEKEKQKGQQ